MNNTKALSQLVDKAFCINLYYRNDRWANASRQFADNGLNVERFNAIDANEIKKTYPIRLGNVGCNMSHILIIQTAFLMGLESVLIFEDDVVLHNQFRQKIDQILLDLPEDWEILMFGGTHRQAPERITDNIYRVTKAFATHAYIIRKSLFKTVLDGSSDFDQPLDCYYTELQKRGTTYITNPPMAWQAAGFSDIERREMNYDFIKTNEQG